MTALLDTAVARWGGRAALRYHDAPISFAALSAHVERTARALQGCGIGPGDAVALLLPNTPWHPVCFFAVLRCGACVVHLSPLDPPRVLAAKLAESGARVLMTTDTPALLHAAAALQAQGSVGRLLVGADAVWGGDAPPPLPEGAERLETLAEAPPTPWPQIMAETLALLQFTGGTTGAPRAAMLSHANLTAAVASYVLYAGPEESAPGLRIIGVLPLFHIYALTCVLLRSLVLGQEVILHPRFDVAEVLHDIGTLGACSMSGVPTMWIALANHNAAGFDFSPLRWAHSGGAPMPADVEARVTAIIGTRLGGGWGMTESGPAGTRIPPGAPMRAGLIGVPLPGIDVRVVSLADPSQELPQGETGELAIRGRNVFGGYWNRPEETRAAFCDGWFLTGDIGVLDADGMFRIVDRKKSLIISGGFNVYPASVENAIYEHPAVREVIVAGIDDAYRGQAAKAFVVLRDGHAPFDLGDLRAFLAGRLGRHEIPAALEIRAELPKSPVGKLLRSVLEQEIAMQTGKT